MANFERQPARNGGGWAHFIKGSILAAALAGAGLTAVATAAQAEPLKIQLENGCSRGSDVLAVVHYLDSDGRWRNTRWYQIRYGATSTLAYTNNRIFYYYAFNSVTAWNGSDYHDTVPPNARRLGFREREIPKGYSGKRITLRCP